MNAPGERRAKFDPLAKRSWTDLGPRLASAVVLIVVTLLGLYLGGYAFALLVGLVFAGCYREWERMVTLKPVTPVGGVLIGIVFLAVLLYPRIGPLGSLLCLAAAAGLALVGATDARMWAWRAAGVIFFGIVAIVVLAVRGAGWTGFVAALFLGITVWLTDTGAYFTGRQVGGEKLAPDISPGKTWSGAIGGFAIGTLSGLVFWLFVTTSPWWIGLGLAAAISILGQAGDLAESAIKRRFRIKDSGDIIPGHGGLMDRLDSLTLTALLVFAIGLLNAGPGNIASGILHW